MHAESSFFLDGLSWISLVSIRKGKKAQQRHMTCFLIGYFAYQKAGFQVTKDISQIAYTFYGEMAHGKHRKLYYYVANNIFVF